MKYANITGWGKCLPPSVLTNDDLSTIMDTSDEWIYPRTGIKARRISHVSTSDLATLAGRRALACAGLEASDLDGIILATATPDNLLPSAASAVQKKLGAVNAAVFDLNAACTGFVYSLSVATSLVQTGMMKKVLVIGAERLTYLLDWARRDTAVLFGDGAGAVVIEASEQECGLIANKLGCDSEARRSCTYRTSVPIGCVLPISMGCSPSTSKGRRSSNAPFAAWVKPPALCWRRPVLHRSRST